MWCGGHADWETKESDTKEKEFLGSLLPGGLPELWRVVVALSTSTRSALTRFGMLLLAEGSGGGSGVQT